MFRKTGTRQQDLLSKQHEVDRVRIASLDAIIVQKNAIIARLEEKCRYFEEVLDYAQEQLRRLEADCCEKSRQIDLLEGQKTVLTANIDAANEWLAELIEKFNLIAAKADTAASAMQDVRGAPSPTSFPVARDVV